MTGAALWRVQWRAGHWGPTTSSKTRVFSREDAAWRFAAKVHSRGGVALVSTATRGPWTTADEVT